MGHSRLARGSGRGYTLVELLVAVAIVGVLAALAVYGMRYYSRQTKSREVEEIIGQIHQGQTRYFQKHDKQGYLNCTGTLADDSKLYPAKPDGKKRLLDNPSHADYTCWKVLVDAKARAPTYHGFAVVAGLPGEAVPALPLSKQPGWPAPDDAWYIIEGANDHDGDGKLTYYVSSSFNPNEILRSDAAE